MGSRETTIEYQTFINHTECHCISRRSIHHHPHDHSTTTSPNSLTATQTHSQSGNSCQCVRHFNAFYTRIESSDEDDGVTRSSQLCRCDCESENVSCDWLKKGKEGFSMEDRRCIVEKRCVRPTCEYGQYSMQIGRCPKLEDKLAGAKSLFFD